MLEALQTAPFLSWSAPLDAGGEFTALDPLALDYLNQQVGNWLFPGLTTRTTRAQYYAVVLYGLGLADEAIRTYGLPSDDATRVELFERWERLWSLSVLESHGGRLERGHPDAMRGVRGATRAWVAKGELPLDFPLISRQQELGGLGAYLSSLRYYGFVVPGDYRLTPLARPIVESFWREEHESTRVSPLHQLALAALDPERQRIPRKLGRATLHGLGVRSRLSALVEQEREPQQDRLYQGLFEEARDDTTHPLSTLIAAAHGAGVEDAEQIIVQALQGRWSPLADHLVELLHFARLYGRIARCTMEAFDRLYDAVLRRGWVAAFEDAAAQALHGDLLATWRKEASAFLDAPRLAQFRNLPAHATAFYTLSENLSRGATSTEAAEHLLVYHRAVQATRGGTDGWLRREGDELVAVVTHYTGHLTAPAFPDLKFRSVRQLLSDCGRLT